VTGGYLGPGPYRPAAATGGYRVPYLLSYAAESYAAPCGALGTVLGDGSAGYAVATFPDGVTALAFAYGLPPASRLPGWSDTVQALMPFAPEYERLCRAREG